MNEGAMVMADVQQPEFFVSESLFQNAQLQQGFSEFLHMSGGQIVSLLPGMLNESGRELGIEVINRYGFNRKVFLHIPRAETNGLIKARTVINRAESPAVLQLVLTLMGAVNHPSYKLEYDSSLNLMLFLEKKATDIVGSRDFEEMVIKLAETADRVENLF